MNWPFWKREKMTAAKTKMLKIYQPQPTTEEIFTAYYIAAWEWGSYTGMNLHYTGEIGDDDFPIICTEILVKLLDQYQTFLCTYEGTSHGYLFPGGWESGENECFPEASLRYAEEKIHPIDLLTNGAGEGIFPTKGLSIDLLTAYFSNPWNEFRTAQFDLFAYAQEQTVESDFREQKEKLDCKACDIFVMYTELPNELEIAFNKGNPPLREVLAWVQALCESRGKTLTVVWHPEK